MRSKGELLFLSQACLMCHIAPPLPSEPMHVVHGCPMHLAVFAWRKHEKSSDQHHQALGALSAFGIQHGMISASLHERCHCHDGTMGIAGCVHASGIRYLEIVTLLVHQSYWWHCMYDTSTLVVMIRGSDAEPSPSQCCNLALFLLFWGITNLSPRAVTGMFAGACLDISQCPSSAVSLDNN